MCILSTVHFVTYDTFSVLYRNLPNRLLNVNDPYDDQHNNNCDDNTFKNIHKQLVRLNEVRFDRLFDNVRYRR
ncbi:hypothetical protein D3C76_1545950 [compost metagenome]